MKKGFFEYIAAADNEKVHSQTIGWLFSRHCEVYAPETKDQILKELLSEKIAPGDNFEIKHTYVEIVDIDILISCENTFVLIENKIKSSQHNNQLIKYENITDPDAGTFKNDEQKRTQEILRSKLNGKKPYYVFLTLIKEEPESNKWINITYKHFYETLITYPFSNISEKDNRIASAYLETLKNLTQALEWMESNSLVRDWVFANANLKKSDLIDYDFSDRSIEIKYIAESGLARFMQKYYYRKVCEEFGEPFKDLLFNGVKIVCGYGSSEKTGEGNIQISFPDSKFSFGSNDFVFGYQIQRNTKKINCASTDYTNSNYKQLPEDIGESFLFALKNMSINNELGFKHIKQKVTEDGWAKAKAYISITKNYNKEETLTKMSPKELADFIKNELVNVHEMIKIIRSSYV